MKNKIFLALAFVVSLSFFSCEEDESLDPTPLKVNGQFIMLNVKSDRFDANDLPNAYFGGTLVVPANNIARYELYVRKEVGTTPTADYVLLTTITSFPYELHITLADIAAALGVDESTLQNGDYLRFYAISYGANGETAQYRDLSRIMSTENTLKQAYRFKTVVTTNLDPTAFNMYGDL